MRALAGPVPSPLAVATTPSPTPPPPAAAAATGRRAFGEPFATTAPEGAAGAPEALARAREAVGGAREALEGAAGEAAGFLAAAGPALAAALALLAVAVAAVRLVATSRALRRRPTYAVLPTDTFDPSEEEVVHRWPAQLVRTHRGASWLGPTKRARAVRITMASLPGGRLSHRISGPAWADSVLRQAGFAEVEHRSVDAVDFRASALLVPSPAPAHAPEDDLANGLWDVEPGPPAGRAQPTGREGAAAAAGAADDDDDDGWQVPDLAGLPAALAAQRPPAPSRAAADDDHHHHHDDHGGRDEPMEAWFDAAFDHPSDERDD